MLSRLLKLNKQRLGEFYLWIWACSDADRSRTHSLFALQITNDEDSYTDALYNSCDNETAIRNSTIPESTLKKNTMQFPITAFEKLLLQPFYELAISIVQTILRICWQNHYQGIKSMTSVNNFCINLYVTKCLSFRNALQGDWFKHTSLHQDTFPLSCLIIHNSFSPYMSHRLFP